MCTAVPEQVCLVTSPVRLPRTPPHPQVESFGVGGHVKLPGPNAREPNVYNFGTPYSVMYNDLLKKVCS